MIYVSSRVANSLSLRKAELEVTHGGLCRLDTRRMTSFFVYTDANSSNWCNYAHYMSIYRLHRPHVIPNSMQALRALNHS